MDIPESADTQQYSDTVNQHNREILGETKELLITALNNSESNSETIKAIFTNYTNNIAMGMKHPPQKIKGMKDDDKYLYARERKSTPNLATMDNLKIATQKTIEAGRTEPIGIDTTTLKKSAIEFLINSLTLKDKTTLDSILSPAIKTKNKKQVKNKVTS